MDIRTRVMDEISRRMGPDFFSLPAPPVFPHNYSRLQSRAKTEGYFKRLNNIYSAIPEVKCSSCADICCRESPDIYLLEYLNIRRHVKLAMGSREIEAEIVRKSLEWGFLRFVRPDTFCPFLEKGRCSIYESRPLNCRMWAIEDEAHYAAKAERAGAFLSRQEKFLKSRGVESPLALNDFLLKKCELAVVEGNRRFTELEAADMELRLAFEHMDIIPREAFKSANFYLNFPGFVALGKVKLEDIEDVCAQSAKEYLASGRAGVLERIIDEYRGEIP